MAIDSNNNYIKGADALAAAKSSYQSGKIGTTDRGTAIVEQNSGLGKDAFLKLLVAQMKNMDPTQDQDSTAYVTQMAQFSSIEQMNNLNTTMEDFAHEQMVGKAVVLSEKNSDGSYKYGIVKQIIKSGTTTTAVIQDATTGLSTQYPMSKIIGTIDTETENATLESSLNSHFTAASKLADDNAKAVYVDINTETKHESVSGTNSTITTVTKTAHKCKILSAYLDKQNNAVKVTIQYLDPDDDTKTIGEPKTVDYTTIAVAGKDLSNDVIKEAIEKNTTDEPIVTRKVDETNSGTGSNKDNSGNGTQNPTDNTGSLIQQENDFLARYGI